MQLKARIEKELGRVKRRSGGMLTAEAIVEYAKDKSTALHSQFDWDDTEAARKWRLEQAARIIRLQVTVIGQDQKPVRAFVSLTTDRRTGIGYREIHDVLKDPDLAAQMLEDALEDLNATRRKYGTLKQLAGVWTAVDAAATLKPKQRADAEKRPAA